MAAAVTVGVGSQPTSALVPGSRRRAIATVTFDSSYPTGGYALTAASFGLAVLDTVFAHVSQAGSRLVLWNQSTGKLQLFSAVGTEVSNATDVHTDSVVVEALGV